MIYAERRRVLEGEDIHDQVEHMLSDTVYDYVRGATSDGFPEEWDLDQLWTALKTLYPVGVTIDELEAESGGDRAGLSAGVPAQRDPGGRRRGAAPSRGRPRPRRDARARASRSA